MDGLLQTPFRTYQQEMVRLDVARDGQSAEGTVLLHAETAYGDHRGDGQLYAVSFRKIAERWLMVGRELSSVRLSLPPARAD